MEGKVPLYSKIGKTGKFTSDVAQHKEEGQKRVSRPLSRRVTIVAFGLLLLLTCLALASSLFLLTGLRQQERHLQEQQEVIQTLTEQVSKLQSESLPGLQTQGDEDPDGEGTRQKRGRNRGRSRNKCQICEQMMAAWNEFKANIMNQGSHTHRSAHLVPLDTSYGPSTTHRGAFKWTANSNHSHNTLTLDDSKEAIVIDTAGIYLVYAMVTYNGKDGTSQMNPPCSYQVVQQGPLPPDGPRPERVLLFPHVTQDKMGHAYGPRHDGEGDLFAFDSLPSLGMFPLGVGDRLIVRPDISSFNCNLILWPDRTNFGVALHSTSNP